MNDANKPLEIQSLIKQCEANVVSFDNDQMSAALHFAENAWSLLVKLREITILADDTEIEDGLLDRITEQVAVEAEVDAFLRGDT